MIESSTSWAYVGPGLRIQTRAARPGVLRWSSDARSTPASRSSSRGTVRRPAGEDLVEKQNAEQGLMPVLEDEAGIYGYTAETRHMVEAFRAGPAPPETFPDGVAVIEMLMALYRFGGTQADCSLPGPASRDLCSAGRTADLIGSERTRLTTEGILTGGVDQDASCSGGLGARVPYKGQTSRSALA